MSHLWIIRRLSAPTLWIAIAATGAPAQQSAARVPLPAAEDVEAPSAAPPADTLREDAEKAAGLRLIVSLAERRLWLRDGQITLHTAPVGIGKGTTLRHDSRSWTFVTPRGRRRVLAKGRNPVWVPPEWHYVELAQDRGFRLARLDPSRDAPLRDGGRLRLRGERVVHIDRAGTVTVLPRDEEIVFDSTVFIPPFGTANRRIEGELGRYKLDLGDGYLLHGTREEDAVGTASTHGCLRLRDRDLELLFRGVPVGTPVYIF